MLVIASDIHRHHYALEVSRGQLKRSSECPERAEIIASTLQDEGRHDIVAADQLDAALLARVHSPEYVEFLATAWDRWVDRFGSDTPAMGFAWPSRGTTPARPDDLVGQLGYHSFAADSSIVAGTWAAAAEAAAIAQTAADRVNQGESAVYGLCRPPGHHATSDQFGGYCYLNNTAIAAQRLLDSGHARVAVLDIDYHHGNGTQAIFYNRSDVLTVSIHANPVFEFPWFVGHPHEAGVDDGHGWNLNLALPSGSGTQTWRAALDTALDVIARSSADALVVALGVDTFVDDPLGTFTLQREDYEPAARSIAALYLPTVIIQEGGYAVDAIGHNVASFLRAFDDR